MTTTGKLALIAPLGRPTCANIVSRNGWGASAVDAISTALVMENDEVIKQIVDHIKTINFNETVQGGESVSLFETTIRYLGGMLSGNSPHSVPIFWGRTNLY